MHPTRTRFWNWFFNIIGGDPDKGPPPTPEVLGATRKLLDIMRMLAQEDDPPLLVGTDTIMPWSYPGFTTHDEMMLLTRVGFSNKQVFAAATLNPAKYLGQERERGTIDVGKMADLVVVEGDPIEDISNASRVVCVVRRVRCHPVAEVLERADQLMEEIKREQESTS